MPSFIKTPKDEERWEKAKELVRKQYGKTEKDGEEFWRLVTGVYKQAGGHVEHDALQKSLMDIREMVFTWQKEKEP